MRFVFKGIGKVFGPFILNSAMLAVSIVLFVFLFVLDLLFILWNFRLPTDNDVRVCDQDRTSWSYASIFLYSLGTFTVLEFVKAYCTKIFVFMRTKQELYEEPKPRRNFDRYQ